MKKETNKTVNKNYFIKKKSMLGVCIVICALCIVSACSTPLLAANNDISDIYSGNTGFVNTSITILKMTNLKN